MKSCERRFVIAIVFAFILASITICTIYACRIVNDFSEPLVVETKPADYISTLVYIEPEPAIKAEPEFILDGYEKERIALAKTVWGEARGCSKMEQAAVIWCILNRVDSKEPYFPDTILEVVKQNNQFCGYNSNNPIDENILAIVDDVLLRWLSDENGRVLPQEYLYFYGDGIRNYFRTELTGGTVWDWNVFNPYE